MDKTYDIYSNSKEFILWPLPKDKFLDVLYGKNDINNVTKVITEVVNGELVGFISVKSRVVEGENVGSVVFMFIVDKYRDRDIGHKLLQNSLDWFKSQSIKSVKFGRNMGSYFWPGVPENLPWVQNLLKEEGFILTEGPVDMSADITNFSASLNVYKTLNDNGIIIEFSNKKYADLTLQFTKENFPNWYEYYLDDLTKEKFNEVFFAHKGDEIVAVSKLWIGGNWDLLFENNVGGGGALGVSEKWRGKGIGLAMKTWGTEILRDKGVKYVWIGWTSSIGFYEKLGFKVWRKYFDAELHL